MMLTNLVSHYLVTWNLCTANTSLVNTFMWLAYTDFILILSMAKLGTRLAMVTYTLYTAMHELSIKLPPVYAMTFQWFIHLLCVKPSLH